MEAALNEEKEKDVHRFVERQTSTFEEAAPRQGSVRRTSFEVQNG